MIVVVGNTKGGVGKTTLAVSLAISRARAGREVWLIDGDRQGTSQTAIAIRSESGQTPGIACSSFPEGVVLRSQVQQVGGKFDDIIIDAGGRDNSALRAALVLSDVLLVPFQPRSFDIWAMEDIASLVDEARSIRDGLKCYAVLNCADPLGSDNREAAEVVATLSQFELLPVSMGRRKAYANAAGQGLHVSEMKYPDKKAEQEMSALCSSIFPNLRLKMVI